MIRGDSTLISKIGFIWDAFTDSSNRFEEDSPVGQLILSVERLNIDKAVAKQSWDSYDFILVHRHDKYSSVPLLIHECNVNAWANIAKPNIEKEREDKRYAP